MCFHYFSWLSSGLAGFFPLHPMTITEAERLKTQNSGPPLGAEGSEDPEEQPAQQSVWGLGTRRLLSLSSLERMRVWMWNIQPLISGWFMDCWQQIWTFFFILCYPCICMLCIKTVTCKESVCLFYSFLKECCWLLFFIVSCLTSYGTHGWGTSGVMTSGNCISIYSLQSYQPKGHEAT